MGNYQIMEGRLINQGAIDEFLDGLEVGRDDRPAREQFDYRPQPKQMKLLDVCGVVVPVAVWKKRFQQIINFEKMLAEEGVTILKFYLHIDKEEQKQRLHARLDDTTKHWKFNIKDLEERTRWNDYIEAYEDVLSKTSSEYAPWVIVPANRKWYRNIVIASVIVIHPRGVENEIS